MTSTRNRKRPKRVHFCLPPLAPDEALHLVSILERLTHAIWQAHGPQMSALLAALPPADVDAQDAAHEDPDADLPF